MKFAHIIARVVKKLSQKNVVDRDDKGEFMEVHHDDLEFIKIMIIEKINNIFTGFGNS